MAASYTPSNPPVKGVAFSVQICLKDFANPGAFKAGPTLATGDFKCSGASNGGTPNAMGNMTVLPATDPAGSIWVNVQFSTDEMNFDQVWFQAIDQTSPKEWADYAFAINTCSATRGLAGTALPAVAAAASGGLLIAGANTGPMSISGGVTFTNSGGDGLTCSSSGSNGKGLAVSGNGSGPGMIVTGGATGPGLSLVGGGTSGDALLTAATSGHGATFAGTGTTKHGINATGGATTSHGIAATGGGVGHGILATSGGGATGDGIKAISAASNGNGLNTVGLGSGSGHLSTAGATGHGIAAVGGATSGDGINSVATTSGHGLTTTGVGTTKHGINATGGSTTSHGIVATGGGVGHGILATSGGGATGDGIKAVSAASNGNGLTAAKAGSGNDLNATSTPLTLAKTTNITGFNDIAATAVVSGGAITTSGGIASADLQTIKGQAVTCAGGVTVPAATLASTTNITAGTITTATNVTNRVTANADQIAGDGTAPGNLANTFNGTGYTAATAPATQSQVSNIAVTGAALNATAASRTLTTGTETNAYTDTFTDDGVYHTITQAGGAIDIYYEFSLGSTGQTGVGAFWQGYVAGIVNSIKVYAYNWGNAAWDQIGTLLGISNTVAADADFALTNDHTGTGGNLGKVRIRFSNTGLTAATLNTDRMLLGYAVVVSYPSNFSALAISAGGHISNVDTLTTYTGDTPQTGDSYAIVNSGTFGNSAIKGYVDDIGVAGAGLTALGDARIANLDAAVSTRSTYAGGAVASVTGAVGSVTGNVGGNVAGSVGSVTAAVTIAAASVQAIWDALTSALSTVGSIGKLLVDNINTTISSRLASGTVASDVTAIRAKTDNLPAAPAATSDCITAAGVRSAVGLASANLDTQIATLATPTNITAGTITTATNLTNAPTVGDLTAAMKASVNAEVVDCLNVDTYVEPTGAPAATASLAAKISRIYQALRNKFTTTSNSKGFYDDSGSALWSKGLSDDGNTYTENKGS